MNISKKIFIPIVLSAFILSSQIASAGFFDVFKSNKMYLRTLFPIPSSFDIQVVTPNGGEIYNKGETYNIEWSVNKDKVDAWLDSKDDNFVEDARLSVVAFLVNEGRVYLSDEDKPELDDLRPNRNSMFVGKAEIMEGSMEWTVKKYIPVGEDYKIRLVAAWLPENPHPRYENSRGLKPEKIAKYQQVIADESDGTFAIVQKENHEEVPVDISQLLEEIRELRSDLEETKKKLHKMDRLIDRIEKVIKHFVK